MLCRGEESRVARLLFQRKLLILDIQWAIWSMTWRLSLSLDYIKSNIPLFSSTHV